jgi:hypothetical protein
LRASDQEYFSLIVFPLDLLTGNKVFVSPAYIAAQGRMGTSDIQSAINSMSVPSSVAELFGGFNSLNV